MRFAVYLLSVYEHGKGQLHAWSLLKERPQEKLELTDHLSLWLEPQLGTQLSARATVWGNMQGTVETSMPAFFPIILWKK